MSAHRYAAVITFGLIGAGACLAQPAAPARDPARLYASTCHFCHDTGIGPPIRGSHYPAAQIRFVVRHGDGAMIAFSPAAISHAQLTALIVWLDRAAAGKPPAGAHP